VTKNSFLYCGEQYSSALGLYQLRARMVNPLTGRFWTADSYEGRKSDPISLHKYLYCGGDPLNQIDPSGHFRLTDTQIALAVGVTVGVALIAVTGYWVNKATAGYGAAPITPNAAPTDPNDDILGDPFIRSVIHDVREKSVGKGVEVGFFVFLNEDFDTGKTYYVSRYVYGHSSTAISPADMDRAKKDGSSIVAWFHTHPGGDTLPSNYGGADTTYLAGLGAGVSGYVISGSGNVGLFENSGNISKPTVHPPTSIDSLR